MVRFNHPFCSIPMGYHLKNKRLSRSMSSTVSGRRTIGSVNFLQSNERIRNIYPLNTGSPREWTAVSVSFRIGVLPHST